MDYEKKYKEALYRAREALNDGTISSNTIAYLQDIFPELVESEDERIRKELIKEINGLWENDSATWPSSLEKKNKYIAWLEKQGEKKLVWRPSKAQMVALHATRNGVISLALLKSLYNDLERL